MILSIKCPWCNEETRQPNHLGRRAEPGVVPKPRFFSFKFTPGPKTVLVCPYCNKPVKFLNYGKRWLLLMVPFVFYFMWVNYKLFYQHTLSDPHPYSTWAISVSGVMFIAGFILFAVNRRLERHDGT